MIRLLQAFAGALMFGSDVMSGSLFSYVDLEAQIPLRKRCSEDTLTFRSQERLLLAFLCIRW